MAPVKTFTYDVTLPYIRSHLGFTLRRLIANPLTTQYAVPFEARLNEWPAIYQTELDLNDQIDEYNVEAVEVDIALNGIARRASKEVLTLTAEKTEHKLYKHYFQDKPLHLFIKPLLGDQHVAMRGWVSSLLSSEHPQLKVLGEELDPIIKRADEVIIARNNAKQALADYRDLGARKVYIDQVNTLRKETHGILSTFPHKHVGLPLNFADQFFRRDQSRRQPDEPTIEKTESTIAELKQKLAEQEEFLQELKEEQGKAQAKAEAQAKAAAQKKLAAAEKELLAKQQEIEALKAQAQTQAL